MDIYQDYKIDDFEQLEGGTEDNNVISVLNV